MSPIKEACTKLKGNRRVPYNSVYEELKTKARKNLWSDEETPIYAEWKVEIESTFDNIKGTAVEFGLVAIARNLEIAPMESPVLRRELNSIRKPVVK